MLRLEKKPTTTVRKRKPDISVSWGSLVNRAKTNHGILCMVEITVRAVKKSSVKGVENIGKKSKLAKLLN